MSRACPPPPLGVGPLGLGGCESWSHRSKCPGQLEFDCPEGLEEIFEGDDAGVLQMRAVVEEMQEGQELDKGEGRGGGGG